MLLQQTSTISSPHNILSNKDQVTIYHNGVLQNLLDFFSASFRACGNKQIIPQNYANA
jgi:hypothetical protein